MKTLKELDIIIFVIEAETYTTDHVFGADKTDEEVVSWAKKVHGENCKVLSIVR